MDILVQDQEGGILERRKFSPAMTELELFDCVMQRSRGVRPF
jgi:hypothetical protein